jgi:hypothetical protein
MIDESPAIPVEDPILVQEESPAPEPILDEPVTEEEETPTSVPTPEPAPLPEELTPWYFDDQSFPDEEPLPFELEEWFANLDSIVAEPEEDTLVTEPFTWKLPAVIEMSFVEPQPVIVNQEPVMPGADWELNITSLRLPVEMTDAPAQVVEPVMQDALLVEVETLVEETPLPELLPAPGLEVIPEEIVFQSEDVTDPEAVQYEAPTEVPAVEIPAVQLTPAELDAIEIDILKYKRVLEINPNNAFGWDMIGGLYKSIGQYSEAILAYQKATALDPVKSYYWHHLGLVYAAEGRYEDAIAAFQKVIEIDPNYSLAHATLGGYYRKRGMEELAQAHIDKAKSLLGVDENEYNRACMEAICGNSDRALELLEIALKNKQTYVNWAKRDPDLDFIRSDPRFHALLSEHATRPTL